MFLLLVCFLIGLLFLYEYVQKCSDSWKKLNKFPGDIPLPFVGNSLQLGFDADDATNKLMAAWAKHGKQNFRFTVGTEHWVLLSDPDDIWTILNHPTEQSKLLDRNTAMIPFFGNSLSNSEGKQWKAMRKLMTPSFHYNTLEKRVQDLNKSRDRLFDILDTHDNNIPVCINRYLRPYLYDFLCRTLMGVDFNLLADPDHLYLQETAKAVKIITKNFFFFWRNFQTFYDLRFSYKDMKRVINTMTLNSARIIDERSHKLDKFNKDMNSEMFLDKETNCESGDLLDKLLLSTIQNGEPLPKQIINDEVTFLSFTGHYLPSITIGNILYCLAKYPEIQEKVIEEFKTIYKEDFDKEPTNQELNQMKYLEAVIKETMRVIPTVRTIGRQLKNDLKLKDGRVIPAGGSVLVFYEAFYQNPKVFPEPEKYNPERHLQATHAYSLVPFGAGARNCIGYRYAWAVMKCTLTNILRRYEVSPGGPGTEPQFLCRLLTECKNDIQLRFKKRRL